MFNRIMIPVDLGHIGTLDKALKTAASLARTEGATVTYVSVTSNAPSSVAHDPAEFERKLQAFADEQASAHGIETKALMILAHDPASDLEAKLMEAAKDIEADVVVMASHVPGLGDRIWPSNGGKLAAHAKASVFVVRQEA